MLSPDTTTCPENAVLKMTRGDTTAWKFQRLDIDGNVITLIADEVYFTVKNSFNDKGYLFQKTLDDMTFDEDGTYHFRIEPEDTNNLKYGDLVYDLEVIQSDVKSTISKGKFVLTVESTWAVNERSNNA